MRVIRIGDCPVRRWRNNGGDTRELASHSDDGNVIWRISVATIDADGSFSRFDGMDRSLVRLDGGVLALTIDGQSIGASNEIVAFRGEASVTASIETVPVRVLNVMTHRNAATHGVTIGWSQSVDRPVNHFAVLLAPYSLQQIQLETGDLLADITPSDLPADMSFVMVCIMPSSES